MLVIFVFNFYYVICDVCSNILKMSGFLSISYFIYLMSAVALAISFCHKPLEYFFVDILIALMIMTMITFLTTRNEGGKRDQLSRIPVGSQIAMFTDAGTMELTIVESDEELTDNQMKIDGERITINNSLVGDLDSEESIITALFDGVFYTNLITPDPLNPYTSGNVRVFLLSEV